MVSKALSTYIYGIQGGTVSARACRYARKLEELSMSAQYSFRPSVICFCHSSLRIGAESNADNNARYELKLLIFLKCFMIFINFVTNFSLSRGSWGDNIFVLAQYDILLKCSVNFVKLGLRSSFCSCAQISTSGISIFINKLASRKVICSAICSLLKSNNVAEPAAKLKLVSCMGFFFRNSTYNRRLLYFSMSIILNGLAASKLPLLISR